MVGCDVCDGTNNHYGHGSQAFLYNGLSQNDIRNLPKSQLLAMNPWAPPAGDSMYLDPVRVTGGVEGRGGGGGGPFLLFLGMTYNARCAVRCVLREVCGVGCEV